MKNQEILNDTKDRWELKKIKKEYWYYSILIIMTLWSFGDSFYTRYVSIKDLSKSYNLTPHKAERISFRSKGNTTAAKFWYSPEGKKNKGVVMKILKYQYVVISATHNIKISILDSDGEFIPLVSLAKLNWVFQAPNTDDYTIVIGGKEKSEILIDIPPMTSEENIMYVEFED